MAKNDPLKLIALTPDDLAVVSGLMQDAVVLPFETHYDPDARRFVVMATRYRWEQKRRFFQPRGERIRAALQINTVTGVRRKGFDPADKDATLALLAVRAVDHDQALELTFAGGAAVRLDVEAIDVLVSDIGESFPAVRRPHHSGS